MAHMKNWKFEQNISYISDARPVHLYNYDAEKLLFYLINEQRNLWNAFRSSN